MSPVASIIMPCFNAAPWIEQALQSALNQTGVLCEVIVVDDGSSDDSVVRARRWATDPRLRVFTQAHAGASAARNHGLRLARGAWIQFLDADDLISPDKIAAQIAALAAAPLGTVATCRWGRFSDDPARTAFVDEVVFRDFDPVSYLTTVLRANSMMHPSAWLVPRAVIERAGPWNESLTLNDDGEFFARVALTSSGIRFVPTGASYYRSGLSRSLSRRRDAQAVDSQYRALSLIEQHLRQRAPTDETGSALADTWQRFLYEYHPLPHRVRRDVVDRIRAFGGSHLPPPWGPRSLALARVVGWRAVARLRHWATRLRTPTSAR